MTSLLRRMSIGKYPRWKTLILQSLYPRFSTTRDYSYFILTLNVYHFFFLTGWHSKVPNKPAAAVPGISPTCIFVWLISCVSHLGQRFRFHFLIFCQSSSQHVSFLVRMLQAGMTETPISLNMTHSATRKLSSSVKWNIWVASRCVNFVSYLDIYSLSDHHIISTKMYMAPKIHPYVHITAATKNDLEKLINSGYCHWQCATVEVCMEMDKWLHSAHYNGCNYLSMLVFNFNHVSKRGNGCNYLSMLIFNFNHVSKRGPCYWGWDNLGELG